MQSNAQGQCFSYYGMWNKETKPKLGVTYYMLDEHITRMVEREKEKFAKEMHAIEKNLESSIRDIFKKQSSELKKINSSVGCLIKMVDGEFNVAPPKKSKGNVKPIKEKLVEIKKDEDDEDDFN